jgi:hypothetical protein
MAKENLSTLKKTLFFEGEKERKERRAKTSCPYRVKRVWDAEKQKYVKVKVYRKRTTFTKAEMKQRFNVNHTEIVVTPKATNIDKKIIHAKKVAMPARKAVGFNMRGLRYEWDPEATGLIRYKLVA